MPNLTISVPEGLKTEMDALSEVNWSEICRKAISKYIAERKNPTPSIELDLRNASLISQGYETGYPTLRVDLRIQNKMNSDITVDRILFNVRFTAQGHVHMVDSAVDLHRRNIAANSVGGAQLHLVLPREKIDEMKSAFQSTFDCLITCLVYVDGFREAYRQEAETRIPIDDWNKFVVRALPKLSA